MLHQLLNPNIALLLAVGVPAIVFFVLRVNAAMVFLSLCLGEVLVEYVASQADDLIRGAMPHLSQVSTSTLELGLLLAPAVVTAIVTVFSVHGRMKNMVNILPALASSALVVLLGVPLLPHNLELHLQAQTAWRVISNAEAFIVAAGATLSLVFLWTQRRHFKQPEKKKR